MIIKDIMPEDMRYMDIPIGKGNAVTRQELAAKWGLDDRTVREVVAKLRRQSKRTHGEAILSCSRRGAGYWRSVDPTEVDAYNREVRHRALKVLEAQQIAPMDGRW
jgi:hypothetical protein